MNKLLKRVIKCSSIVLVGIFVAKRLEALNGIGGILFIGALSNYGETFAKNCLRKFYSRAIAPVITNSDYEGEIKGAGERLNILSFLEDIVLGNYEVGTNMNIQHPVDTEDQLVITEKKYYNFDIDVVDKEFTYVEDEDSTLIENATKGLEKLIDTFVLGKVIEVKAGHRVGSDFIVAKEKVAGLTAGGVLTFDVGYGIDSNTIVGKGVYLKELAASPSLGWYKIKTFSDSSTLTICRWNDKNYDDGAQNADFSEARIEATHVISLTKDNIYAYLCKLAKILDDEEIPDTDRYIVIPAAVKELLIQASQLQPDIAVYHEETVINGKVGRAAGFDIHMAVGSRVASTVDAAGTNGYQILAGHKAYITFGHKFAESRVIDSENQFAKLYQGLNLYGAKVTTKRRKAGAMLYATV